MFPVSQNFSMYYSKIPCVFPVWNKKAQIPCFSCAVATLQLKPLIVHHQSSFGRRVILIMVSGDLYRNVSFATSSSSSSNSLPSLHM